MNGKLYLINNKKNDGLVSHIVFITNENFPAVNAKHSLIEFSTFMKSVKVDKLSKDSTKSKH